MKILFFSPSNAGYRANNVSHGGGGWIVSLLEQLKKRSDIDLAVSFAGSGKWAEQRDGVTWFPLPVFLSAKEKLQRKFNFSAEETLTVPWMKKILSDFQPDVIHIFGSEEFFGLITKYTDIPCIIHLQGFLPLYYNAKFPPGCSKLDFVIHNLMSPRNCYRFLWNDHIFRKRAEREISNVQNCNAFFGRTEWDHAIVQQFHPEAQYFPCWEILRDEFYQYAGQWHPHSGRKLRIVSTISTPTYKGHDMIMKTAYQLKKYAKLDFSWSVFGCGDYGFWSRRLGFTPESVNVKDCGVASASTLCRELLESDIYFHPSYIDNSPNSLCEAQLLGMPVIAVAVGGVPSLVEHRENGFLIPANDPLMAASRICEFAQHPEKAQEMGARAARDARLRHDPDSIADAVLSAYKELLSR